MTEGFLLGLLIGSWLVFLVFSVLGVPSKVATRMALGACVGATVGIFVGAWWSA